MKEGQIMNNIDELHKELKQKYENEIAQLRIKADEASQSANEYKRKKAEYEAEKKAIEQLAGFSSCLDRMDAHYNRYVEAMKNKPTEDKYKNYAKQFRWLEGYKDSNKLADECDKLAIKTKYNNLVQRKNKASSEDEYKQLSKEFSEMSGYESSTQLADECDKLAIKAKYDNLVQGKNKALSEDEFKELAKKFREMNGYENSAKLADECDKQVREIKERLAEIKRKEAAEQAEREKKEANEREAIRRAQEARERKDKNIKHTGLLLQFGIMLASFFVLIGFGIIEEEEIVVGASFLISLAFGIISLIFRRGAESKIKIPWGIVFLLLTFAVFTVTAGVFRGWNIVGSIISVLIPAVALIIIISNGIDNGWGIWGYILAFVVYAAAAGILGGIFKCSSTNYVGDEGNYSMLNFLLSTIVSIPGMIMIIKAEE